FASSRCCLAGASSLSARRQCPVIAFWWRGALWSAPSTSEALGPQTVRHERAAPCFVYEPAWHLEGDASHTGCRAAGRRDIVQLVSAFSHVPQAGSHRLWEWLHSPGILTGGPGAEPALVD